MALRIKGHTNHDMIKTVAIAVTALILFSCQKELVEDNSNKSTLYPVINRALETTVRTRAYTDNLEGTFIPYADNRQTLTVHAIAFDEDGRNSEYDVQGIFAPQSGGLWRSTVEAELGYTFSLYSYSRTMPTSSTPQFTYTSESDVKIAFNGLDVLSTNDPLVCVAASGKLLPENASSDRYPDLENGKFSIGMISKVKVENVENSTRVFLAMDHLYSKATLNFRVDNTYSQFRDIRIKNIQVKTDKGTLSGSHSYNFYRQALTLDANKAYQGSADSIDLFDGPTAKGPEEGKDYIELTTSSEELGYFYFVPVNPIPTMYLTVTYDILDKKGNVTRANQTARNDKVFSIITSSGYTITPGTSYKINILVSPTYLYQLSDDDVEFKSDI